jgi:hypothetical protein
LNAIKTITYLLILSLFASCDRSEEPTTFGLEYFPIEVGKYKCYTMDSIAYYAFSGSSDTFNYFIKETVETSFIDNAGNKAFRLKVDVSFDTALEWNFSKYLTVHKDAYSAQLVENDLRYVKLSFPVKNRKSWDENEYNVLDKQLCRYIDIDEPFELNGKTYMNTLAVDKGDSEDPYFRFFGRDVYAVGTGLILEEYINTETQQGKTKGNAYTKTLYSSNW